MALKVLAATGQAYLGRSAKGQSTWRIEPAALQLYLKQAKRTASASRQAASKKEAAAPRRKNLARVAGQQDAGSQISITIHIPDKLLRRLFGSDSNAA